MSKTIYLNFYKTMGDVTTKGTSAYWTKYVFDQLATYFDLDIQVGDGKGVKNAFVLTYKIIHARDQSIVFGGESVVGSHLVSLKGSGFKSNDFRGTGYPLAAIMHETLHAIGFPHTDTPSMLTVLHPSAPTNAPFLLLFDFENLRKSGWKLIESSAASNNYSWDFAAGKAFLNGSLLRNLQSPYDYDILYQTQGTNNTIDFSNQRKFTRIDLRASIVSSGGPQKVTPFGSVVAGTAVGQLRFNIYNAPGVVLHNAKGGTATDEITGNDLANRLWGNGGDDSIAGLGGDDTLNGGSGRDFLDGGEGSDTADYSQDASAGGLSGVLVNLSTQKALANGVEIGAGQARDGFGHIDTLVSIEDIIGTSYDDWFLGSDQDNSFSGLKGADTLFGGDGFDIADYSRDAEFGGLAGVRVNLSSRDARVGQVRLEKRTVLDGFGDRDTLVAIEKIIGTQFADIFVGGDDGDRFDAAGGEDVLHGGQGADTLDGGEGRDTLEGGASGDLLDGGGGDDSVNGGAGDDTLFGHDGNDELRGGTGDDVINGGAGDDILFGGDGSDVFEYGIDSGNETGLTYGHDLVRGFDARGPYHDMLKISKAFAADLDDLKSKIVADPYGALVFKFSETNSLTLWGVTASDLDARDVRFV